MPTTDGFSVIPTLNYDSENKEDDDMLSSIEREMMERRNDDVDEQRLENAIKVKDLLYK